MDNAGQEFILAFPENRVLVERPVGRLSICSRSQYIVDVTISIPLSYQFDPVTYTLKPQTSLTHDLSVQYHLSGNGIEYKGVLIEATGDIVVQAANINDLSTDAFLVLPTQSLGVEYFVMSYVFPETSVFRQGPSELAIVGTEDHTIVQIVTSEAFSRVQDAKINGRNLKLKLDWCETFQLQSYNDLTGTRILANKRIAVLSGAVWTSVGREHMGDHLVEMMIPTQAWGKEFLAAPLITREAGDIFRILASQANTSILLEHGNIEGGVQSEMRYLDRGSYLDVDTGIYNSTALHVLATRPVLVAQFCKSYSADDVRFSDPFMALIPPMTQYTPVLVTSIFTSLMGNAYINYLMIVVPTIGREALRLNGRTLPEELILDEVRYVLGTVYTTLTVRLPDLDSAMFTITDGVADFGVIQYGLKFQESYGMLAGQGLDPLPVTCLVTAVQWRDGIDNDCDGVADEEIANGIDDDGDSLIDEDVWDDKSSHPVEVEGYDVVLTIRPHVRVVPTTADTVGPSTVQSLKTTTRNFYTTFDHDDDDAAYTTDTTSTELDTTHVTSATFPQTSTRMYSTQTQTRLSTGITERTTSPENAEETSGIPERSETVQKPTETIVQRTSETLEESPTTSPFPRTSHHSDGTTLISTLFTSDKSSTEDVRDDIISFHDKGIDNQRHHPCDTYYVGRGGNNSESFADFADDDVGKGRRPF
ncbi:hypothetical protein LSH36_8g06014 [Paralvinella palmiformis]|uniref:IgGFc-binding protein N-terminal domain-containing protein n=1 Tax=Paralvinella palmiformis TaxID=53620 RepID=A0AAD9NIK1_9ANNE|nr:hypothetical protein LSH36_8g06014 [Paralvinella palmiformis]